MTRGRNALMVLTMVALMFQFVPVSAAQEGGATVNVQLIVDASGSMAAPTNTGEVRMDSAKRVLTEVVNALPDTPNVNVGLRVYGHQGDNTDEGRAASCVSSELLVPMQGVNTPQLLSQVSSLQPVGWTPIGFAMEQAAADFAQPAGPNVVNSIVVVTDGLETCDADPVAIAGQLRSSDIGVITHVVGFGTTPDEQVILSGIAQSGEGQLLSSNNTGQLLSAVFQILEDLQVVEETGSGETRTSPLGIGRIGEVGDYEVSVISVTPNGNDIVAAENQFNEPPAPGRQFFLARVAATYIGSTSGNPAFDLDFQSVGASSSSYTVFNNDCGVVPDNQFEATEQFTGGSVEFTVCWEIDAGDATSLVMYVEELLSFDDDPVWFSLGNPIQDVVNPDATPGSVTPTVAAPTPTPVAQQIPATEPGAGLVESSTRQMPVPVGQVAAVSDYEVSVVSTVPLANDVVAAENQFNEPPIPGSQFFIATVSVTYVGTSSGNPAFDLNFQAVGASNSGYTTFNNTCGVYPNDQYLVTEQFTGGTAEFNVCWAVETSDAASLVMYVEDFLSFDSEPVWFSLQP